MTDSKMRVILLTHGQCEAFLERLFALEGVEVAGVFVETDIIRRYSPREALRRSVRYDGYPATFSKFARKLLGLGNSYDADVSATTNSRERLQKMAEAQRVPIHFIPDFHADEAAELMRAACADLGVIYGTNIIKESVFKIPRLGSINLHQGLAPIYRGGPPVFWELFNGESEVGITVHFVEAKVDTGRIVLQETIPLDYDYARFGLDYDSFIREFTHSLEERCARLMTEAIRLIAEGKAETREQDTSLGKRYRLPVKAEKDEMRRRLRERNRRERSASQTSLSKRERGTEAG